MNCGRLLITSSQNRETFDRHTSLTRKQSKVELVEKTYGCLRELSLNGDLGNYEESINQDVFNAKVQDGGIQSRIPRKHCH